MMEYFSGFLCIFLAYLSLLQFAKSYDGFNLTGTLASQCESPVGLEGRFKFLGNTAEAWFHVESGWAYFEYLFPAISWTGIGASNQTISDIATPCLDCYFTPGNDVDDCLSECLTDNIFVITGEDDPNSDAIETWQTIEIPIENNLDPNDFAQFPLASLRLNASFYNDFREFQNIGGVPYIHGWWFKSYFSTNGDEWNVPIGGGDPICWTTIASSNGDSSFALLDEGFYANKSRVEIHCPNTTNVCTDFTTTTTGVPTSRPTVQPTIGPTTEPGTGPIPRVSLEITPDICSTRNLSLILYLDASNSISDAGWNETIDWAIDTLNQFNQEFEDVEPVVSDALESDIRLCLRVSIVKFASEVEIVFDFNQFGDCYDPVQGMILFSFFFFVFVFVC